MAVLTQNSPNAEVSSNESTGLEDSNKTMNVFVKWNEGKTMCLQVDSCALVADLALLVWQHALKSSNQGVRPNVPSRDFCMVCRGKVLDTQDNRALWEIVGSQKEVNLQVWTRQRGGCFMVSLSILGVIMAAIVGSTCTCGLSLFIVPLLLPLLFILPLFCL